MVDINRLPYFGVKRIAKASQYTSDCVVDYTRTVDGNLREWRKTHVLFTHAMIERAGNVHHDVLADVIESVPGNVDLGLCYFDSGVTLFPFHGPEFGGVDYLWRSTIFGCPVEHFDYVAGFLQGIRVVNYDEGWAGAVGMDRINIPDPLHLLDGKPYQAADKVGIFVFSVTTPKSYVSLRSNDTFGRHTVVARGVTPPKIRAHLEQLFLNLKEGRDVRDVVQEGTDAAGADRDGAADSAVPPDPDSGAAG